MTGGQVSVFWAETHDDFVRFWIVAQSKFAVMLNTSWVEPLKVAFRRDEASMNLYLTQWQNNNTIPYVRLLFEERIVISN